MNKILALSFALLLSCSIYGQSITTDCESVVLHELSLSDPRDINWNKIIDCLNNGFVSGQQRDRLLLAAVSGKRLDVVKLTLEKEANINSVNPAGQTPIIVACQLDTVYNSIVFFLLSRDADVAKFDLYGHDALYYALGKKNYRAADELIRRKANVNYTYPEGTLLNVAVENNDSTGTEYLISKRADPTISIGGRLPLNSAVSNNQTAVAIALLGGQPQLHIVDSSGHSAFEWALINNNITLLQTMITRPLPRPDAHNNNILHRICALNISPEAIVLIAGKDSSLVSAQNDNGQTPLHVLCASAPGKFAKVAQAEALLKTGASPDIVDNAGKSPSDIVFAANDQQLLELLLRYSKKHQGHKNENKLFFDNFQDRGFIGVASGYDCVPDNADYFSISWTNYSSARYKWKFPPIDLTGSVKLYQFLRGNIGYTYCKMGRGYSSTMYSVAISYANAESRNVTNLNSPAYDLDEVEYKLQHFRCGLSAYFNATPRLSISVSVAAALSHFDRNDIHIGLYDTNSTSRAYFTYSIAPLWGFGYHASVQTLYHFHYFSIYSQVYYNSVTFSGSAFTMTEEYYDCPAVGPSGEAKFTTQATNTPIKIGNLGLLFGIGYRFGHTNNQ